jgi:hypothetical protein
MNGGYQIRLRLTTGCWQTVVAYKNYLRIQRWNSRL